MREIEEILMDLRYCVEHGFWYEAPAVEAAKILEYITKLENKVEELKLLWS